MFDSVLERAIIHRVGSAYDCWGIRRTLKRGSRNRLWFLTAFDLDLPAPVEAANDRGEQRADALRRFEASGLFTRTELDTLRALVIGRLTLNEIASRDGCSRQAVVARLAGNSRGQGGIIKKARKLLARPRQAQRQGALPTCQTPSQ